MDGNIPSIGSVSMNIPRYTAIGTITTVTIAQLLMVRCSASAVSAAAKVVRPVI